VAGNGFAPSLTSVVDDKSEGFELSVSPGSLRSHTGGFGPRGAHLSMPGRSQRPAEVWARWVPEISAKGDYRIQAYIPRSAGASTPQAWYRVFHLDGEDACPLDQRQAQGGWVDLCEGRSFRARAGQTLWVELNDVTGSREPGRVALDALRFQGVDSGE
jgi:hypothetical protein